MLLVDLLIKDQYRLNWYHSCEIIKANHTNLTMRSNNVIRSLISCITLWPRCECKLMRTKAEEVMVAWSRKLGPGNWRFSQWRRIIHTGIKEANCWRPNKWQVDSSRWKFIRRAFCWYNSKHFDLQLCTLRDQLISHQRAWKSDPRTVIIFEESVHIFLGSWRRPSAGIITNFDDLKNSSVILWTLASMISSYVWPSPWLSCLISCKFRRGYSIPLWTCNHASIPVIVTAWVIESHVISI